MLVLHLVPIMPSYSMKTINRMHANIYIGNPALDRESNSRAILIRI